MASQPGTKVVATNRQARRDFELLDSYECGMVLKGSEVKSLREAKAQLAEAYGRVIDGELWILSLHISPYGHASPAFGHDPDRPKKLLVHGYELDRIRSKVDQDGLTLVPLSLYFKEGRAKLELALARRKRNVDRRHDIAKRDADREARRAMRRDERGD